MEQLLLLNNELKELDPFLFYDLFYVMDVSVSLSLHRDFYYSVTKLSMGSRLLHAWSVSCFIN
jgi:hypothetical protein